LQKKKITACPTQRRRRSPGTSPSDLPHLLDPAYSGILTDTYIYHSSGSSNSTTPPKFGTDLMYVDGDGVEHDPDYRMFPVRRSTSDRRRRSGGSSWERERYLDTEDEDDEDDDTPLARPSNSLYPSTPAQQRRSYPSRAHTPDYHPSYRAHPIPSTTHVTEKNPGYWRAPFSFDQDASVNHIKEERSIWNDSQEYLPSRFGKKRSVAREAGIEINQDDWHPTCSEALVRQWQSLALSLRFAIFRTKRRIKRRVGI
jgi:hypothetical protein